MTININIDEENHKFYAMIEGAESLLSFRILPDGIWDYHHTFVPPRLRHRGIAKQLVEFALEHARKHGLKVLPSCSYVRAYVDQHPEWRDILVE